MIHESYLIGVFYHIEATPKTNHHLYTRLSGYPSQKDEYIVIIYVEHWSEFYIL